MYPMYYYGFDWSYVVLVLPCILLSLWASANVNSTFKKYSGQFSRRHLTGAEAAQRVLSAFGSMSDLLIYLGIACFGLSLVFQLVTLPVEFNASRRALAAIEDGQLLTDDELSGARKTLRAAALTYVAATAVALAQLLRLLAIFGGRRRND